MLKKIIKWTLGILISFIVILIGIPSLIFNDALPFDQIEKSEQVVEIIKRNQSCISPSVREDAVGDGKCIRQSIKTNEDWTNLFAEISISDKNILQQYINSNICEMIEVSESNDCIMFLFKTSFHDSFIIGSYQQLYLIFEDSPACNCKNNPIGAPYYPIKSEKIKDNWYKVTVRISRRYFHG
jgi:hypothetical protein